MDHWLNDCNGITEVRYWQRNWDFRIKNPTLTKLKVTVTRSRNLLSNLWRRLTIISLRIYLLGVMWQSLVSQFEVQLKVENKIWRRKILREIVERELQDIKLKKRGNLTKLHGQTQLFMFCWCPPKPSKMKMDWNHGKSWACREVVASQAYTVN
jgi:hypothetical protein